MFDFKGKTAIVTGAASGIGEAIALELAASGAFVIVSDLTEESCANPVATILDRGGKAAAFAADVADPEAMKALVDFAEAQTGALHLAVNNAGIGGGQAPTGEYPIDAWQQVININLNGVFYGMRYQLPALERAGGGAIVNMASILGSVGFANSSAYVASKHALLGLTKTAAMEYAQKGIRINSVGPAFIQTPLLTYNLSQDMLDGLASLHPMGRIGISEEVSALTCFLLSDRASFITGSYHLVDGGYTAQ
ncbi:SDR family NAD(P)-dependent oxidoreductase [Roseinatronobacter bogoriensis]|uniref:Short-chain dehydrogenase n=1 Tax=Roseinatronobacter bogoriensis subsp. barguzinensis TaxID=441209 RepID=A0A2K8K8K6_9RHOB|nr:MULTISPECIES: SDR family oxidoreductase [Rhodobaca]ATX65782.1 short-chain dehydrogenase [Rhodobaca barguzinensis]MBB4208263.1 NAD(P)-dependent dehydrogenase (short-subunit alcohol dehydrogenase family) [Rhodobaca bogoriensis DSM 18756]TDW38904.1 NAD(P)-dependent dehydrogenase (short-subunit alcohol dehydrogenase family) [Rhodobaca barguzinensis]TDY68913.1 NAD(P)-dependent dehydrogenase (short-subunit alcohol dehydrogenase family) [Rhodobaca bogoriensis DSM 18756]